MRRLSPRKPSLTVSMFPFLAVLVCTMGALIVLLVVVVQKARFDVKASIAERKVETTTVDESLGEERDVHVWRREVLEKQRTELQNKMGDQRLTLSHLEDHIRRLETRWRELTVQAKQLEQLGESKQQDEKASAERIQHLQEELETARAAMEEAKVKAAAKPPTFAIVPYEGPNGTKRRPIYIECTDAGIVLQPTGIVLRADDFQEPLGPGNPLDAALRTTREYLARQGDTAINGEPYPLLIVRPNGIVAYAVARAAIKSWDDEFGYELVDADMKLAFPSSDTNLRPELEKAIAEARSRQSILAAAMPGRFKHGGGGGGFVASTSGGFRPVGSVNGSHAVGASYPGGGASGGGGFSSTFRPSGNEGRNGGIPGAIGSNQGGGSGQGGSSSHLGTAAPGAPGTSDATGYQPGSGNQAGEPGPGLNAPQIAGGNQGSATGSGTEKTSQGSADKSFGFVGKTASSSRQKSGQSGGQSGSGGGGAGQKGPAGFQPLASTRGENWGLPNRKFTPTGFTRLIQVECWPDRLVVLPEKGDYRQPVAVATTDGVSPAIDPFVAALWKHMETWGIAAEAGYWKPIVKVQVAPGADQQFEELKTLLEGSGLAVERK